MWLLPLFLRSRIVHAMRWSCLLWWLLTEMISTTTFAEKRKLPTTPSETIDGQELLQHLQQKKANDRSDIVKLVTKAASRNNNEEEQKDMKKTGLVVIPGLGRVDRLDTVLHNLRMLAGGGYLTKRTGKMSRQGQKNSPKDLSTGGGGYHQQQQQQWDCVIYIYADRNDPKTAGTIALITIQLYVPCSHISWTTVFLLYLTNEPPTVCNSLALLNVHMYLPIITLSVPIIFSL